MKIAVIQMVSSSSVAANLSAAGALLAEAASAGAELAVLPEYFCLMGQKDTDKLAVQEPPGHGPIQDFLSQQAQTLGLWIVGGTLPLSSASPQRVRNASLAYAPSGRCVARYDKVHLFRFAHNGEAYDETRVLSPGVQPVVFEIDSKDGQRWRIGMSVCYDLRFPELYRALAADVLLVPSAFTHTTGEAHWDILLRARAIENLAFVAAAAQGGNHDNGRRTWGHSLVASPWGKILAERTDSGAGVVLADIDKAQLEDFRSRLPALAHRVF